MYNKREKIPLMQKGTALWLKKNTKLTPDQIVEFCRITITDFELLTDQTCRDFNPLSIGQLTHEEITRCEVNPDTRLKLCCDVPTRRNTTVRFLDKRQKEALQGCVLWMTENTKCKPEVIGKLLGRGPKMIAKIIEKNNAEPPTIKHPVEYGFCDHETLIDNIRASMPVDKK